jgi:hypothetical protein
VCVGLSSLFTFDCLMINIREIVEQVASVPAQIYIINRVLLDKKGSMHLNRNTNNRMISELQPDMEKDGKRSQACRILKSVRFLISCNCSEVWFIIR